MGAVLIGVLLIDISFLFVGTAEFLFHLQQCSEWSFVGIPVYGEQFGTETFDPPFFKFNNVISSTIQ
jgi:hypothetical protein